jgi:hypothetical protein
MTTLEEFGKRVAEVLLKKGYVYQNEEHIDAIMAYWGCLEEFDPDPDDAAIVHMYEVLDMYDFLQGKTQ